MTLAYFLPHHHPVPQQTDHNYNMNLVVTTAEIRDQRIIKLIRSRLQSLSFNNPLLRINTAGLRLTWCKFLRAFVTNVDKIVVDCYSWTEYEAGLAIEALVSVGGQVRRFFRCTFCKQDTKGHSAWAADLFALALGLCGMVNKSAIILLINFVFKLTFYFFLVRNL